MRRVGSFSQLFHHIINLALVHNQMCSSIRKTGQLGFRLPGIQNRPCCARCTSAALLYPGSLASFDISILFRSLSQSLNMDSTFLNSNCFDRGRWAARPYLESPGTEIEMFWVTCPFDSHTVLQILSACLTLNGRRSGTILCRTKHTTVTVRLASTPIKNLEPFHRFRRRPRVMVDITQHREYTTVRSVG